MQFFIFSKAFHIVPHSILPAMGEFLGALSEELAEGQSSKGYSEWGYFWLVTGHQWCSLRVQF